jgi:hypothetical protein
VDSVFDARGVDCETVYRSDRDDWVLAMIASGFGFWLLAEIFDLEPGRRCQAAGQSGVLAGSKPDDGEGGRIRVPSAHLCTKR